MIRRQFLLFLGQLSVISFVLKGQTQERISMPSDLAPTVDPQAIEQFQRGMTLSSAPLGSGPLCGQVHVGLPK